MNRRDNATLGPHAYRKPQPSQDSDHHPAQKRVILKSCCPPRHPHLQNRLYVHDYKILSISYYLNRHNIGTSCNPTQQIRDMLRMLKFRQHKISQSGGYRILADSLCWNYKQKSRNHTYTSRNRIKESP